jgi:hypothetical protein
MTNVIDINTKNVIVQEPAQENELTALEKRVKMYEQLRKDVLNVLDEDCYNHGIIPEGIVMYVQCADKDDAERVYPIVAHNGLTPLEVLGSSSVISNAALRRYF